MKKISIFIESKGKVDKVNSLFSELGFENINVIPTKGRLFDLPISRYGINNSDFSRFSRVPLSERKLDEVRSAVASSDVVFLLTDDDIEGEIISYDLSKLESKDSTEFYRIRLKSLTSYELESALSKSSEIINSKVIGGISRRIFDRYLGYNFTKPEPFGGLEYGYVGRIVTPVISSLKEDDFIKAWISRSIELDGEKFNLKLPIYSDELDLAKDFFSMISDIEDPEINVYDEETIIDDSSTWNGTDALIELSSALSSTVSDVSDALQELYEEGKISYPRTDSFYLSEETINAMKKMAIEFGVSGFDDDFFAEKANLMNEDSSRRQDAHEAIVPIVSSSELNIYTPLSDLGLNDQILTLMARNILRSGQKERKTTVKKASFSSSSKNSIWIENLSRFKGPYSIERSYSHINFKNESEIIKETKPLGSLNGSIVNNSSIMRIMDNEEIVLRRMRDLGLGRPSTDASHAKKISSKFMNRETGILNETCLASISYSMQVAPNLRDPYIARKIEDSLHYTGGNIDERVRLAISLSGIDTSTAKASFENDSYSEFDIDGEFNSPVF